MIEEEQNSFDDIAGPMDAINPIPFGVLMEDQYRRTIISNIAFKQVTKFDPDNEPLETVTSLSDPAAAALYAHALSPQVALLDLTPQMAQAVKIDTDMLFYIGGMKYRRTKHRVPLSVAHAAFRNTINGMSTQGTFSLFLAKMGGAIREVITGRRSEEKK